MCTASDIYSNFNGIRKNILIKIEFALLVKCYIQIYVWDIHINCVSLFSM